MRDEIEGGGQAVVEQRQEKLEAAMQRRKELIAKAQQNGKTQGQTEAEQLGQQSRASENELRNRANKKNNLAVTKITDFIQSQA